MKNNLFATHAVAAAASVAFGTAVTYPLDTLKVLVQVGSSSNKLLAPAQAFHRVQKLSGISGLYSGIGWLIPGRIFGMGARFSIYEILTAFYKDGRTDNYVYVSEALMAGVAAGSVDSLLSSPFEIIKLRAQVTSASRVSSSTSVVEKTSVPPLIARLLSGYSPKISSLNNSIGLLSTLMIKHPNMGDALKGHPWMMSGTGRPPAVSDVRKPSDIMSLEGSGAFWRGLRSGVARDSVFSGIFFCTWQFLHLAMLDWKAVGIYPPPRSVSFPNSCS